MSARDPLIQAERRCKSCDLERSRWDVPLPRAGGALSHTIAIIQNLPRYR